MKRRGKSSEPAQTADKKSEPYRLYAHPLFMAQLGVLQKEVERLREIDPTHYHRKNAAKRLAAITRLIFEIIPADPARPEYRQGHTLGKEHAHWFRAKFFQQYRLFFRYDEASRVIVYAWVNDEKTLRAYGSRTDAYAVFKTMLDNDNPPDSWKELLTTTESLVDPEVVEQE